MTDYHWVGSQNPFVDKINIMQTENNIILGRFGGNSSAGQYKNEDGCLIWADQKNNWEFVIILDAHDSAQSAELVVNTFKSNKESINKLLNLEPNEAFINIENHILNIFNGHNFKAACEKIKGETACLIVIRKENYLWWFSIGDCVLLLSHPELSSLGEYQQNHRSFYEWIGQKSTFNKKVPCYSSGTKELRKGENHIFLTTDGLIECPNTTFNLPEAIFEEFNSVSNKNGVKELLEIIKRKNVRDSTTIISWKIINNKNATMPSNN